MVNFIMQSCQNVLVIDVSCLFIMSVYIWKCFGNEWKMYLVLKNQFSHDKVGTYAPISLSIHNCFSTVSWFVHLFHYQFKNILVLSAGLFAMFKTFWNDRVCTYFTINSKTFWYCQLFVYNVQNVLKWWSMHLFHNQFKNVLVMWCQLVCLQCSKQFKMVGYATMHLFYQYILFECCYFIS